MGGGSWTWRLLPRLALHAMARASTDMREAGSSAGQARNSSKVAANRQPQAGPERYILHPSQAEIDELPKEMAMNMSGR